jgi:hypothetical protein
LTEATTMSPESTAYAGAPDSSASATQVVSLTRRLETAGFPL